MNLKTLKWGTKFITSLVGCTPQLKLAEEAKATGEWGAYKPIVDKALYNWLVPICKMGEVDFKVKGLENIPADMPIIYTPNHSGLFDFPAMILTTPKPAAFMSKKEAKKLPFINRWMDVMDCVFVDRGNKEQAKSTLHEAIEMVGKGRSIVIYPEGTRSKNGELGKFKGGAMKIAMETGAKVVPVLLEGTRERLDETGNITPGTVYVSYLQPIETKGLSKDDFLKMPEEIKSMLQKERDYLRSCENADELFKDVDLDLLLQQ